MKLIGKSKKAAAEAARTLKWKNALEAAAPLMQDDYLRNKRARLALCPLQNYLGRTRPSRSPTGSFPALARFKRFLSGPSPRPRLLYATVFLRFFVAFTWNNTRVTGLSLVYGMLYSLPARMDLNCSVEPARRTPTAMSSRICLPCSSAVIFLVKINQVCVLLPASSPCNGLLRLCRRRLGGKHDPISLPFYHGFQVLNSFSKPSGAVGVVYNHVKRLACLYARHASSTLSGRRYAALHLFWRQTHSYAHTGGRWGVIDVK